MKKGDLKKQEILRTAEARFCRYGYEATGVQEIIDELHTSKGSFYHHFASKAEVLEEICRTRASENSGLVFEQAAASESPLSRLNILFSGMIPFSTEKLGFLLMLLPVFSLPEGISIRNRYAESLADLYTSAVASTLSDGTEKGILACPDPVFSARIAVLLVNQCWMKICDSLMENEMNGNVTDPSDLLSVIIQYRNVIERILSAPFGSVELIRLQELRDAASQIRLHWKRG